MSNLRPSYYYLAKKIKVNMNQVGNLQQNRALKNIAKIENQFNE